MSSKSTAWSTGSFPPNGRRGCIFSAIIGIVTLFAIIGGIFFAPTWKANTCLNEHWTWLCGNGIGVTSIQVGGSVETVGISDGSFAFDTYAEDGNDKQNAADAFTQKRVSDAITDWNSALRTTTDDGEALIYKEDQNISGSYVTVVVATTLSRAVGDEQTSLSVGRDDLRGVYMAQKEYNTGHKLGEKQVRVLVANIGVKSNLNVTEAPVLQQIIQLSKSDPTFVGVMGFPFSNSAEIAYPVLEKEHIAIISPSASSNQLSGKSSYFFRVVPPDDEQTRYGAQYATQVLRMQTAAVFLDPNDPYSESLGDSFASNFLSDGTNNHVSKYTYTKGQTDTLNDPLHTVLQQNPLPNMIFFAGYADDLNVLKEMVSTLAPNIVIMGGDASYELGGYDHGNYAHFYFTAFTYPDIWDILCPKGPACTNVRPAFVDDYAATFDPNHQHPGEYSYARTGPHAILAYDATVAFLQAGDSVLHSGDGSISTDGVRNALQKVKFQGVSGQVSFSGSNPVNKSIVVLCVDSHHLTHLVAVFGQFIDGGSAQQKIYSTDVCM